MNLILTVAWYLMVAGFLLLLVGVVIAGRRARGYPSGDTLVSELPPPQQWEMQVRVHRPPYDWEKDGL